MRLLGAAVVIGLIVAGFGGAAAMVTGGHRAVPSLPTLEQRGIAISAQVGFRVRAVEVEGRRRASAKAILAALGVARGTPILEVDPAVAKSRLEQVPWVRSVSVYRRLPDTLYIAMTEQEPLAFWQHGETLTLIDREGRPIAEPNLAAYARLPVLVGDDAPAHALGFVDMLATEPKLAKQVTAAVRIGGRRWNVEFKNGISVELPEEDVAGAWHRLAGIEKDHRILERRVLMVDLRLPDRIYLQLPPDLMPKPLKGRHSKGDPV
jgi:cell division protein FtsQ